MPISTTFAGRSSSPIVAFFGSETLRFGLLLSQCSHPAVVMGTPLTLCFRSYVFPSTGMMSSVNWTCPSPSCFTSGFAQNTMGVSSWLTHALRKVTVRCPSKKYWVVYEPGGILPGSTPPDRHSGTQPRILACWCSPPPLAPLPQALSARATRATITPVAKSALSFLMPYPFLPNLCRGIEGSRLHHWLPTPPGAHLLRDAVLGLCPMLGGTVSRLWGMAHRPNVVSLLLLGVTSMWQTSENAQNANFAYHDLCELRGDGVLRSSSDRNSRK